MRQKIIRDPIYDYISIEPDEGWLLKLLDSREVQRLRYIHQLGVSHIAYPGACHTRFGHTLGVLHLMKLVVKHLRPQCDPKLDKNKNVWKPLLAAAVLHDIGHGPFSHLLEGKLGCKHEEWSHRIINDKETEVHEVLRKEGLLKRTAKLLKEDEPVDPPWLKSLISSQLDVDRMDYLLRDSYFTGVGYGRFDFFRLIHTMDLEQAPAQPGQAKANEYFAWPDKSMYALEEYIFARFYMYQSVYYHHCTRGYEKLLEAIWDRARSLPPGEQGIRIAALEPFLCGNEPSPTVRQYLSLGECHVLSQLQYWRDGKDVVLRDLCGRFLSRKGFKTIEVKIKSSTMFREGHKKYKQATEYLKKQGPPFSQAPDSYFLEDSGAVQAYKPYRVGEGGEEQLIFLKGHREISDELKRLKAVVAEKEVFTRCYCPEEHKTRIAKIANS